MMNVTTISNNTIAKQQLQLIRCRYDLTKGGDTTENASIIISTQIERPKESLFYKWKLLLLYPLFFFHFPRVRTHILYLHI